MFSAISADVFRWRAFYSLLIVLIGTLGFPSILYFIVANSGCEGIGGACGGVAVLGGVFVKSLILLVAGLIYAINAFKRMKCRFSRLWCVYVVAVIWCVGPALFALGNFWGANFSAGILFILPLSLFKFLPLIVLTILLSVEFESKTKMEHGIAALCTSGKFPVGKIYCISAVLMIVFPFWGVISFVIPSIMFIVVAGKPIFFIVQEALSLFSLINGLVGCWFLVVLFSKDDAPTLSNSKFEPKNSAHNSRQPIFGGRKT